MDSLPIPALTLAGSGVPKVSFTLSPSSSWVALKVKVLRRISRRAGLNGVRLHDCRHENGALSADTGEPNHQLEVDCAAQPAK